jgi:hypothetical protein
LPSEVNILTYPAETSVMSGNSAERMFSVRDERRCGIERRHFDYTLYIPERREGGDRRSPENDAIIPAPREAQAEDCR